MLLKLTAKAAKVCAKITRPELVLYIKRSKQLPSALAAKNFVSSVLKTCRISPK